MCRSPRSSSAGGIEYNYRREPADPSARRRRSDQLGRGARRQLAAMTGTDVPTYTRERPGMSAFVLEDGVVYHTYSTYARGLDGLWGMYQWLDRAPKGRNETGVWWRRHDEYGAESEWRAMNETDNAHAANWLSLAAAPTFAIMALLSGIGGASQDLLCTMTQASPFSGMTAMYLLMSAFHLAPWLRMFSIRTRHARDQRGRIGRQGVAAPGDMLVGARQHQLLGVGRAAFRGIEVEQPERHVARRRGGLQRRHVDGAVEAQQRVAVAHRVIERAAVAQEDVRRAAARHGRGREAIHGIGRLRRAVIGDDRRAFVVIAEVQPAAAVLLHIQVVGGLAQAARLRIARGPGASMSGGTARRCFASAIAWFMA